MHNINIDKLLQQLITTNRIVDTNNNILEYIDEYNFFTLTDQNKLLVSVWYLIRVIKDDNDVNITNFIDLVDNTFNTNTNFASLIASVLTVKLNNISELVSNTFNTKISNFNDIASLLLTTKINNLDELVTKLNNLTVQTTNAVKPVVLTDNVVNSIEVTNYSNATYQLVITGLIGSFSINVLGSLDNTNWFTLPLMTSSLVINNNAVLVSNNSTIMLNVNCNCKFIKLNIVSLPALTRIDAKLYLK